MLIDITPKSPVELLHYKDEKDGSWLFHLRRGDINFGQTLESSSTPSGGFIDKTSLFGVMAGLLSSICKR